MIKFGAIFQQWRSFRQIMIDQKIPRSQVKDMRNAFYAGAGGVFNEIMRIVRENPDNGAENHIAAIEQEFEQYSKSFFNDKVH